MSSKADILGRIRRNLPEATSLPDLNGNWITFPDPRAQFVDVLGSVGGQAKEVARRADLLETVRQLPCLENAQQIVSLVPEIPLSTLDLGRITDPHELAPVDVAIAPGEFAVAENAAVWVTDQVVRHRALYFLTQHLVLVVSRDAFVQNLHQAYERLEFSQPGYGLWISGPSKTADIEQSLVIGAHGPRSLTVLLVGEDPGT